MCVCVCVCVCVCTCVHMCAHVCMYVCVYPVSLNTTHLLSRLDWRQRDSLGVDDWQDLVADHRGDDLALGIGQQLRCDWLDL